MNSTIEVYAQRFEHVLYVEDYSSDYSLKEGPVRFTVDPKRAKMFEHEEALRISNVVFDYLRTQFRTQNKQIDIKKEVSVYVNDHKKSKDEFPSWVAIALFAALFIGMCIQFSR